MNLFNVLCPGCGEPYEDVSENSKSKLLHSGLKSSQDKVKMPTLDCVAEYDYVLFRPCGHCCPETFGECPSCKLGYPGYTQPLGRPTKNACYCGLVKEASQGDDSSKFSSSNGQVSSPRNQIFVSYSQKDSVWLEKLEIHLKPLVRTGVISAWNDTQISAGARWYEEIQRALSLASVAVLLVSPNFLASDFIVEHELPPLLEKAKKDGVKIIWIAVSASLFSETEIAKYQSANDPGRPLDSLTVAEQNATLVNIALKIKAAVSE